MNTMPLETVELNEENAIFTLEAIRNGKEFKIKIVLPDLYDIPQCLLLFTEAAKKIQNAQKEGDEKNEEK